MDVLRAEAFLNISLGMGKRNFLYTLDTSYAYCKEADTLKGIPAMDFRKLTFLKGFYIILCIVTQRVLVWHIQHDMNFQLMEIALTSEEEYVQ